MLNHAWAEMRPVIERNSAIPVGNGLAVLRYQINVASVRTKAGDVGASRAGNVSDERFVWCRMTTPNTCNLITITDSARSRQPTLHPFMRTPELNNDPAGVPLLRVTACGAR